MASETGQYLFTRAVHSGGGGGGGGGGQMGHLPPPEKLIYFSNIVFEIADSEITRKSTN